MCLLKPIVFISVFYSFNCFSQLNDGRLLYQPGFELADLCAQPPQQTQDSLTKMLCLLDFHCDACIDDSIHFETTYSEYLLEHSRSINFIDFDGDGDYDVIFNGKECSGFEMGNVEIYENTGDSLIQHFKTNGSLIYLDLEKKKMVVQRYPCCAERSNYISEFQYDETNFEFEMVQRSLFVGHFHPSSTIIFPAVMNFNDPISLKDSTDLRWCPDTKVQFDPTCENNETNIICRYAPGATGTVLYKSHSGWTFVRMNYHTSFRNYCALEGETKYLSDDNLMVYGWIQL